MSAELDPLDALTGEDVDDPNPDPITDKDHKDFVEPASGIKPRKKA